VGTILENIHKNVYLILLGIIVLLIGIFGMVTSQWLFGVVLIALIAAITFVIYGVRLRASDLDPRDEAVTILSGVVVAFLATAIAPWLAWAVVFMFLFLFQKSLARIEKRLESIESGSTRRYSRSRSRNGVGARHLF
jgi:uncharacterized membrane protein